MRRSTTIAAVAAIAWAFLPFRPTMAESLLIRGATVIDPVNNATLGNQCIVTDEQRITSVLPCDGSETADRVIDASDRFVIPGLWDMHVHAVWDRSVYRDLFADFVAWGVTGIRDMGGNAAVLAEARQFLSEDEALGPTLIAAGYALEGPTQIQPMISVSVSSHDDGARAVADLDTAGADFVKIYTTLPADAASGVFEAARRRGLPVAGHLPADLTILDAIDGGMTSIEHMVVELGGLCDVDDAAGCAGAFEKLRNATVYLTPTLLIRQRPANQLDRGINERARIDAMPPVLADEWRSGLQRSRQQRDAQYFADKASQYLREQRLTEFAIEQGSLILVGTDTGDFLVPPGSSIHEEMALLVGAGMSEMEVLRSATSRAAEYLGFADRGQISAGAVADLVILTGNPLTDIRHTEDIETVVLRGRALDKSTISCIRRRITCDP